MYNEKKDKFYTVLAFLLGVGLFVAGILGVVLSLSSAEDYSNATDIRKVDAVIESVSTHEKKLDDEDKVRNYRIRIEYRTKVSYVVDGKTYKGKYELYDDARAFDIDKTYDRWQVGDTIQIEVYKSKNGNYKIKPDNNPVVFLIYCAVIPIGFVVTILVVIDMFKKRSGKQNNDTVKKRKQS